MRIGVFIGRFQPFHLGHEHVVREALSKVDKLVILIGSAGAARSARNPWTFNERRDMITNCFRYEVANDKLVFQPIHDHPSDERWMNDVRNAVAFESFPEDDEINLVGFSKDQSSFYLKLFPEWGSINVDAQWRILNATNVRNSLFSSVQRVEASVLPTAVCEYLDHWRLSDAYYQVYYEHAAVERYKSSWKAAPFPPTFITGDAVIVQSGHVLLIRRGEYPFNGLLALPGGFLEPDERVSNCSIRESREETQIADARGRIPHGRLASYAGEPKVFDNPYRDPRGRFITHVRLLRLPDAKPLWSVAAASDAKEAGWHPIASLSEEGMAFDHFHIIQDMLGL